MQTALKAVNTGAIRFLEELRGAWETPGAPCVINGAIGPRGDGYKAGNMDAVEAEAYHSAQIGAFAEAGADMVTAFTLNSINEAVGVVRAAMSQKIPAAISFTVETDGCLVRGESLREAIEAVELRNGACMRIFPDQLRASDPFRERTRCRRGVGPAHPRHQSQCIGEEPCRARRGGGARQRRSRRSRPPLPLSQARVSANAYTRRLLRYRSQACRGRLRGLPAVRIDEYAIQIKWPGLLPAISHFVLRLSAAARCRAGAAAARPGHR